MEKQVVRWSYLLGLACTVLAFLWRLGTLAGLAPDFVIRGSHLGYLSFLKGAVLFLVLAIATSSYMSAMKE
jgi:hypothetical protein